MTISSQRLATTPIDVTLPAMDAPHLLPRAKAARSRLVSGHDPTLQLIWDVVSIIPRGSACTYGNVARAAGLPGRARLVGFALKTAPAGLHLPWHRVVGAGGRIVFPKTSHAHREQGRRLRAEGILVLNGRVPAAALVTMDHA